ncbi:MAG: polysaccharide deacetylase family protein [Gaiellaceae bacterium]
MSRPLVLCYHAVSERWEHRLAISLAALERQVRTLLLRRFRPASAAETLTGRGRLLHVTFDDAFRSVDRAIPVLERLGVPATVFACPSYAGDGRPLAVPELAAEAARLPAELATMSWHQLRGLVESGIEVGSHTSTHAHLTRLDADQLERELRESKSRLEDELGRPCRYLAYPYGEEDARVRAAARAAGYEAAFALPGPPWPLDRYALPRVGIFRKDALARATLKTTPLRHAAAAARRARSRRG